MLVAQLLVVAFTALASTADAAKSTVIQRPNIKPHPHGPSTPFPSSTPRTKVCKVEACKTGGDDAPAILDACRKCNNGGIVQLDGNYTIASPLDLTFLNKVDLAISGTINFSDDVDYWITHTFKYAYQNSSAMWTIGGHDVNIYGNGVGLLNGNGQAWYDRFATNATLMRPTLMMLDGIHGGSVVGLKLRQAPTWNFFVANSSFLLISDIDVAVASKSSNIAKNTDGWDTYRSDNVVIQNSIINNGDDCVSFKPNSTNVIVQNLVCNGSHGISVGSLGQYPAEVDIVENIYVYNVSMSNASDGARIKVWPGAPTLFEPGLNGGGGSGYVKNITYDTFYNFNNDWAIEINQCYGQSNATLCNQFPSKMAISDVYFRNMWGTTSKKYDPKVGTLVCSSPAQCTNIQAHNITVSPPSGKVAQWVCTNVDTSKLDINCIKS